MDFDGVFYTEAAIGQLKKLEHDLQEAHHTEGVVLRLAARSACVRDVWLSPDTVAKVHLHR